MTLKTFRAHSMADALAAVKKDLGKDAVILHTRSVKSGGVLGLGAKTIVEVIASTDVNVARRSAPSATSTGSRQSLAPRSPAASSAPAWNTPRGAKPVLAQSPTPSAVPSPAAAPSSGSFGRPGPVTGPVEVQVSDGGFDPAGLFDDPAAARSPSRTALSAYRASSPARDSVPAAAATATATVKPASAPRTAPDAAPAESSVLPVRERRIARLTTPAQLAPQDAAAAANLYTELAAIKRMVTQVLQTTGVALSTASPRTAGLAPSPLAPGMPDSLFSMYLRLLECEVSRELADTIIGAARDELTPAELADEAIVRQTVLRRLAGLIPVAQSVAAPTRPADGRPLTIALVGPTGVGKTTTIAKLAASYKLRHGKRVGLITADTYRIAAVDQLRTYAGIIGLPLKVVMSPDEMAGAVEAMSGMDAVLIDTAGRSPNCAERIDDLRTVLAAARPHETHLVLSSASDESVMLRAADAFGVAGPNRVLFTKLDEAVNFGVLVNVAQRVRASLSFVTTGQEVPDHIEPGHPDRLARLILDGCLSQSGLLEPLAGAAGGVGR